MEQHSLHTGQWPIVFGDLPDAPLSLSKATSQQVYHRMPFECKTKPPGLQLFAVHKQTMTQAYEALAYIQK